MVKPVWSSITTSSGQSSVRTTSNNLLLPPPVLVVSSSVIVGTYPQSSVGEGLSNIFTQTNMLLVLGALETKVSNRPIENAIIN